MDVVPNTEPQQPPTNEQWMDAWNPHLMTARIAWHLCQKTKAELIGIIDGMDEETADEVFGNLEHSEQFYGYFHNLITSARLVVAGSVLEVRDQGKSD